jgi:LPS sulfotransferase NodH
MPWAERHERSDRMLQRFILLASPRTGSNLVGMALHAHPAVVIYGELFHVDENERKAQLAWKSYAPADYYRDGADPVAFLEKEVYRRDYPAEKTAAGFKLFHTHLHTGPAARFSDWLAASQDIRIIHLHRKRLLEAYVSYQIASTTRQWLVPLSAGPHGAEAAPVRIDIDSFKRYADEQIRRFEQAETLFRDHPLLTIEYHDDVCTQFETTIRKLEAFLGIPSMPLPKKLQKQAKLPLGEEIANFHELHDALEGTRYEAVL